MSRWFGRAPQGRSWPAATITGSPEDDGATDALLRYLESTRLRPAPDLVVRIGRRIGSEPPARSHRGIRSILGGLRVPIATRAPAPTLVPAAVSANMSGRIHHRALGAVVVSVVVVGTGAAAGIAGVHVLSSTTPERAPIAPASQALMDGSAVPPVEVPNEPPPPAAAPVVLDGQATETSATDAQPADGALSGPTGQHGTGKGDHALPAGGRGDGGEVPGHPSRGNAAGKEPGGPKEPSGPREPSGPKGGHGPKEPSGPREPSGPKSGNGPKEPSAPKGGHGPKEPSGPKDEHSER
jgi:hypothetical protein